MSDPTSNQPNPASPIGSANPFTGKPLPVQTQRLIAFVPILMRLAHSAFAAPPAPGKPDTTNPPSINELMAFAHSFLDWLVAADPSIALIPAVGELRAAISLWTSYGPDGPFAPTPTYTPGPGTYRGR